MMGRIQLLVGTVLLSLSAAANGAVFVFDTDPFGGSTALTTPGRQVVGGEAVISFNTATDVFDLASSAFGVGSPVLFINDEAGNLPTGGVNVIVLETLDNDGNAATPFAAGSAADLIASHITSPGPGFFVYFNQGLDLPRLVFSTDLSDNTADLKILFRMVNLAGHPEALPTFAASNFAFVEQAATIAEPSMLALLCAMLFTSGVGRRHRQ